MAEQTTECGDALKVISEIEHQPESDAVLALLVHYVGKFGFRAVHLGHLVHPANYRHGTAFRMSNWPSELIDARTQSEQLLHDPVARFALQTVRPFRWSTAILAASRRGMSVADEVRNSGLVDGWMFPMHAPHSLPGGVSLGAFEELPHNLDIPRIGLVCQAAYYRLEAMHGPLLGEADESLTARETEVLQYVAIGKTNWEIATILGLSEQTVPEHVSRACRKLDASNRAHAVAIAISRHLIFP